MAVFGFIDDVQKRMPTDSLVGKAISFLKNTDLEEVFKTVSSGNPTRIDIEGNDLFAVFQEYNTISMNHFKFEGHKRYIDVQYILEGSEQVLIGDISQAVTEEPYHEESDIYFVRVESWSVVNLEAKKVCILYPEDIHAPCISPTSTNSVKKIVIKVAVDK